MSAPAPPTPGWEKVAHASSDGFEGESSSFPGEDGEEVNYMPESFSDVAYELFPRTGTA